MQQRHVTRRNMISPRTTEGQWVLTMRDQGMSKADIVDAVERQIGGFGKHTQLVIEYMTGEKGYADIEFLLTPHEPSSIEYVDKVWEGYLLQAKGDPDATFKVLLRAPGLTEAEVRLLLRDHQEELCFLAFKNAHEGHPHGYSKGKLGTEQVAEAGISYPDIVHLLQKNPA